PGDNAAYGRTALESVRSTWENGFWEPDVHRALKERGARLMHDPTVVAFQGRSAGAAAFVRQRLAHGRAPRRQRGAGFGTARNVAAVFLAFAVPALLLLRQSRTVLGKGRHRGVFLASLPLLAVFDTAWALGELLGHADTVLGR